MRWFKCVANPRLQTIRTQKDDWKRESASGRLYAVIDSCDEASVPKKVAEVGPERAVSLYRGGAEEQYAMVAPYLFKVDESVFDWIANQLWASPWGIFASAHATIETLRTHFRHFLTVKGADGKKYLFRFYDPRILPGFLTSCKEAELREFYGPVRAYGAKADNGVSLLRVES
jgi:hypothetical protein